MRKKIDPVVDEAIETLNMKDGPSRRRLLEGAGLFSATAAASALIAAGTYSRAGGPLGAHRGVHFIELRQRRPDGVGGGGRGQLPDHAQVEVHVRKPRDG